MNKLDGWQNILTNLGKAGKDKRTGMEPVRTLFQEQQLDLLYECDDLTAKVIDKLPEDMTREGFVVTTNKGNEDITTEIESYFEKLDLDSKLSKALRWSRLYGGAGIFFNIEDGGLPNEPLNVSSIKSIQSSVVINRFRLKSNGGSENLDKNMASKNFGMPVFYNLVSSDNLRLRNESFQKIHYSRIVRFIGVEVGESRVSEFDYWGDSLLSRLYNHVINIQGAYDSAAVLMTDFSQMIFKLKNLSDMIASGSEDLVQQRLALLSKTASIINAIVVEEGEEVDRKSTNVSGVKDILSELKDRFIAATEYPHTVLFGEGATGGLGTQGQSEKRDYYDVVKNKQEEILRPILRQIINLILLAKDGPTNGKFIDYSIKFKPLWQPTEKEIVETRNIQSQIDERYINLGVLDADEVTDSRFGDGGYSFETKINKMIRKQINKQNDTSSD